MTFHDHIFVPNPDSLHCTQASFMMALEALSGQRISMADAERLTGFVAGVETWPYAMIAEFARRNFEVRHVDAVDSVALTNNPEQELRASGLDEETLDYFMRITDFARERDHVEQALATGNVTFEVRIPDVAEIPLAFDQGWLPILSLDAAILSGREHEKFEGHVVVVRGHIAGELVLDDPGPPSRPSWCVPLGAVADALKSPAESSGTITFVRVPAPIAN